MIQHASDISLVVGQVDGIQEFPLVDVLIDERRRYGFRQEFIQDLNERPRVDRPPVGRKTDLKSHGDIAAAGIHAARSALKNFLPGARDVDQPALS